MRVYVITTGIIFTLLTAAHVLRMITENPALATDPAYLAITLAAAALAVWAWVVIRRENV